MILGLEGVVYRITIYLFNLWGNGIVNATNNISNNAYSKLYCATVV